MKKALARILSFIFIASFALLSVGCIGNDSNWHDDLIDRFNRGEITYEELQEQLKNNMPVPLHGVKVLYRPENYDYDGSVGEGNQEYYGQYAWWILSSLIETYGFSINDTYIKSPMEQKYLYDTIRYNLFQQDEYNTQIIYQRDDSGSTEFEGHKYSELERNEEFTVMSANIQDAWNWSFNINQNPTPFLLNPDDILELGSSGYTIENNIIKNTYTWDRNKNIGYYTNISDYYNNNVVIDEYNKNYLGTEQPNEDNKLPAENLQFENYSDYVKALEYVIYCITLDINPGEVQVKLLPDGTPEVKIKQGNDTPISVDEALAYIKDIFNKIGTYVGFSDAKQAKLVKYILDNVIGSNAISADEVKINRYDTVKIYMNGDNIDKIETTYATDSNDIEFKATETIKVNRDYTNTVTQIVEDMCKNVHIGSEEGGDHSITDRFPASNIKDYYGTNFMVASDDPFKNIEAMEYQSVVLMFREAFTVDNISLHFKYDAGNDGDDKVTNSAIDIKVYVNVYNKGGERRTVATDTIRVKDGPHDYGMEGSTMMLFGIDQETRKGYTINPFNTELAGGLLHHPDMKFDGTVSRSEPYPLTGTSIAKNYYELVEASDEAANNYYSYGRLNPKAFTPEEDCDYLEINFEVLKVIGDYTTNYKFYTGVGLVK